MKGFQPLFDELTPPSVEISALIYRENAAEGSTITAKSEGKHALLHNQPGMK